MLLTFVDAASLVAEIWTVVHFVTLFGAVNAGAVATLELIRTAGQHSCKTGAGLSILWSLHIVSVIY